MQNDNFWQKQGTLIWKDSKILYHFEEIDDFVVNGMVFAITKTVGFRRCDFEDINEIKRFFTD